MGSLDNNRHQAAPVGRQPSGATATTSRGGPIRVVVIDDHQMVLDSVARALDAVEDLQVVGVASTGLDALRLIRGAAPDVALVDFDLSAAGDAWSDGLAVIEAVGSVATRFILVTGVTSEHLVGRAIGVGCAGFVVKGSPLEDLVDAVRAVARGHTWLPADALAHVTATGPVQRTTHGDPTALSAREVEVLTQVAAGLDTKAIATQLGLSEHTVRNHVKRIMAKLGVHSRLQAVHQAIRRGILDTPR